MNRYLLNISYIGTQFRGIQKIFNKAETSKADTTTVQGCLELALQTFRPINPIEVVLSSRTDAGVHALHSAVHVDLENPTGKPYHPLNLTTNLNRKFSKDLLPIRVISTQQVPSTFHCRYKAIGRTYLYRFAVPKEGHKEYSRNQYFRVFNPIEEVDRCYFLLQEFDVDKFNEAASLFVGRHDFRTFMKSSKKNEKQKRAFYTVRTVAKINIAPGIPATCSFNYDKTQQLYNYWDLTITGRSFLHKQVRRMAGTLLAAAYGKITNKDIYEMLTIPSKNSWNPRISVMPGFGLYLCKVHYNEEDLKFPQEK